MIGKCIKNFIEGYLEYCKHLCVGDWVNILCYLCTAEYYAAIKKVSIHLYIYTERCLENIKWKAIICILHTIIILYQ